MSYKLSRKEYQANSIKSIIKYRAFIFISFTKNVKKLTLIVKIFKTIK